MIDPHIKPKHNHRPATNLTAHRHADMIGAEAFTHIMAINGRIDVALTMRMVFFKKAMDTASHFQNFLVAKSSGYHAK